MAVTENTYTGNGSTVLYSFTFPYLAATDIKVSINGTLTTAYTLANATTVQFNSAPANGAAIRIYRSTNDTSAKASFFAGSSIRAQDLNDNFTQGIYIAQETANYAAATDASAIQATANTALANSNTAITTANAASATANGIAGTANTALSNSNAAVSTANTASSTATAAQTTANAALPKAGGTMTGPIIFDASQTFPSSGITAGTTSTPGIVQLTDSTSSTSTTTAATPNAVKSAFDAASAAVTTAKLADDAVTTAKILDLNITSAKIADGAITSAKILDGTVAPSDLSTGRPSWDASGNLTAGGIVTAGNYVISNNGAAAGHCFLSGNVIAVQSSTNRHLWFYNSGGGTEGIIFSEAATGDMHVRSENGTALVVHRNADLGASAPYWRTTSTGGRIRMTTGNLVNFHWNNGFYYNIDNNTFVLINASASDANLKDVKQQGVPNALDLVMSLNPVRFAYKEDCPIHVSAEDRYGFIAQELQEVIPELIQEAGLPKRIPESPDEEVEDPGTYLRYADDASKQLIAVLTAALQETVGLVQALEARIAALEPPS